MDKAKKEREKERKTPEILLPEMVTVWSISLLDYFTCTFTHTHTHTHTHTFLKTKIEPCQTMFQLAFVHLSIYRGQYSRSMYRIVMFF